MAIQPELFPDLVGPEFIKSSDIEQVAEEVLDRHGRAGGVPALFPVRRALLDEQVRVAYLLNTKPFDPLKDDVTHDAIAKCVKAPRLWHDVTGFDLVVWVRAFFWNQFDEHARAGVLLHELLHIDLEVDLETSEIKVALRHHDVEEFIAVVRHYGAFIPNREALVKAFGLWQQDGGQPAAPAPVNERVVDAAERFASRVLGDDVESVTVRSGDREVTIDRTTSGKLAARRRRPGADA